MLSSSFFALFTMLMQFPTSIIISKIGRRNTLVLGNIINIFSIIAILLLKSFGGLLIHQTISAIAFAFKNLAESNLLSISIPDTEKSGEIFTKIDKSGYSRYYLLASISTILAGIFYNVNHYIPIFLCLICTIIATLLSFNFGDIEQTKKEKVKLKDYINDLKKGYKFTVNSKRLRALLLASGIIWGIIALVSTYQLSLLQYIGASSIQVGFIFASYEISKAIFSQRALNFNKRFKNKSITNILALFSISLILCGIIAILKIPFWSKIFMIIIFILIMGTMDGISQILTKKYLNSFTDNKILICIYSAKAISDNAFKILITSIGSIILTMCSVDYATLLVGLILIIVTFLLSMYMNGKVGLNPDKYTQKDIYIRKY